MAEGIKIEEGKASEGVGEKTKRNSWSILEECSKTFSRQRSCPVRGTFAKGEMGEVLAASKWFSQSKKDVRCVRGISTSLLNRYLSIAAR